MNDALSEQKPGGTGYVLMPTARMSGVGMPWPRPPCGRFGLVASSEYASFCAGPTPWLVDLTVASPPLSNASVLLPCNFAALRGRTCHARWMRDWSAGIEYQVAVDLVQRQWGGIGAVGPRVHRIVPDFRRRRSTCGRGTSRVPMRGNRDSVRRREVDCAQGLVVRKPERGPDGVGNGSIRVVPDRDLASDRGLGERIDLSEAQRRDTCLRIPRCGRICPRVVGPDFAVADTRDLGEGARDHVRVDVPLGVVHQAGLHLVRLQLAVALEHERCGAGHHGRGAGGAAEGCRAPSLSRRAQIRTRRARRSLA